MSINAIVDGTTYEGITAVSAVGKTFALTEIQEESGGGGDIWQGASEGSIRWMINNIRNATKTGTFTPASLPSTFTQMFDTGLGDNWSYIVIYHDSINTVASGNTTNLFLYVIKNDGTIWRQRIATSVSSSVGTLDMTSDSQIRISDGKVSMKTDYGNTNQQYSPVLVGSTYRWMAW